MDDIDDLLDDFENVMRKDKSKHVSPASKQTTRTRPVVGVGAASSSSTTSSYSSQKSKPISFGTSSSKSNNINNPLRTPTHTQPPAHRARTKVRNNDEDDLSDLLDLDISSPIMPKVPPLMPSSSPSNNRKVKQNNKKSKCSPPILEPETGPSSGCQALWCVGCDFKVSGFDNYIWEPSVDYLFFRNSYPEKHKLATKMIACRGARAYACQCTWHSINETTSTHGLRNCRWVCLGCMVTQNQSS